MESKNKLNVVIAILLSVVFITGDAHALAPEWHMVDCNSIRGQGDCHLLTSNGINALVDAGQPHQAQAALVPYLNARRIRVIEHFFISHPHTDHYGGLEVLIRNGIQIKNVYYNALPEGKEDFDHKPHEFQAALNTAQRSGAKLHNVRKGFALKMGDTSFKVLHAEKKEVIDNRGISINDYSIILRWDAGGYRSLFTGDLNTYLGGVLADEDYFKADILKVPHHGVTGIAPDSFFNRVDPIQTMNSSPRVLYRHPRGIQFRKWTEQRARRRATDMCTNGHNGSVVLRFHANRFDRIPQKPSSLCRRSTIYKAPGKKIEPKFSHAAMASIIRFLLED